MVFLVALQRVLAKYFSRLSCLAKFYLCSFFLCFLIELAKTIAIKIYLSDKNIKDVEHEQRFKMLSLLIKPIASYIYYKYCYAVYLVDIVKLAFNWQTD